MDEYKRGGVRGEAERKQMGEKNELARPIIYLSYE
jgi:hypothetical protein